MRHSRSISDLRADVAENCRVLLMLAEREGLSVLVTETVRDAEYQRMLAEKGYAAKGAVTPSFHAEHAGLAFDICKNEAGHEYDDPAFFIRVGEIGKMLGFSWGGDWGSFPDRPHFQWDAGATYTSAMIRAKRYPPPMPRYEEEEMTQQQFDAMMENYLKRLAQQTPAGWSAEARAWAEKNGLIAGDEAGNKQYRDAARQVTKGTGKSAGGSPLRRFFALSRQKTCRKSCKLHALHKKNVKRLHGNDKKRR